MNETTFDQFIEDRLTEEKHTIIRALSERGFPNTHIAKIMGCSQQLVSYVLKKSKDIVSVDNDK
jgi:predicted transcriptional regulator